MIFDELISSVVIVFGILLSSAYYLQAWKIVRTKSAKDISVPAYIVSVIGTLAWVLYGFYKSDIVIITGYIFGVAGSLLVLLLTLYYRRNKGEDHLGP